ncbi:hypothetical protein CAPTEDRAFT_190131 [Capitella teleta]|uniref:Uncharacterized protein n=1 Tax=Capitella teleta TaxID=283909 RepID=R7UKZ3_CAPTE|nr:hypothetical protein CAPTEDRAFT_190131 [Capitella teleta]|eukprot:ELU07209.1 hypothetical protein CAPTEDRAFT_190131 [Capitella teleta]
MLNGGGGVVSVLKGVTPVALNGVSFKAKVTASSGVIIAVALTAIGGFLWFVKRRRHRTVSNMSSGSEHSSTDMADVQMKHSSEKNELIRDKTTSTVRRRQTEGATTNKKRQGMVMEEQQPCLCRDENSNNLDYEHIAKEVCAQVLSESIKTFNREARGSHERRLCDADAKKRFAVGSTSDVEREEPTAAGMGAVQDKQDVHTSETESHGEGVVQNEGITCDGDNKGVQRCDDEENSADSAVVSEYGGNSSENDDLMRDDVEEDVNANVEHAEDAALESMDARGEMDITRANGMDKGAPVRDSGICELKEIPDNVEIETDYDEIVAGSKLDNFSTPPIESVKTTDDIDSVEASVQIKLNKECNSSEDLSVSPKEEIKTTELEVVEPSEPSEVTSSSALLMTKLTDEKQRRRSAEEWTEIFEFELEAHIKARVEAEQKCAEMKSKYQRLLRKYKELKSGKHHWETEEEMEQMSISDEESGIDDCHGRGKPFSSLGSLKRHWSERREQKDASLPHRTEEPLDELLDQNEVRRQPVRVKIQGTPPPSPLRTSTPVTSQRSQRGTEQSELSSVLDGTSQDSISNVTRTRQAWETLFTSGVKASPSTSPLLHRKTGHEECASMNSSILSAKELWEEKVFHGSNPNLKLHENGSMISDDPDVLREYKETSTTEAVLADSISNINETRALWETKLAQEEEEAAAMKVLNSSSRRSPKILRLQKERLSASESHPEDESTA